MTPCTDQPGVVTLVWLPSFSGSDSPWTRCVAGVAIICVNRLRKQFVALALIPEFWWDYRGGGVGWWCLHRLPRSRGYEEQGLLAPSSEYCAWKLP